MTEIAVLIMLILSVTTNVMYIALVFINEKEKHGGFAPMIRPAVDALKPWTNSPKKGRTPKVHDDESAWRKENGL